jgi:hypothetical protein
MRLAAILFLIAGTLSLVYGGFTYTSDTHKADVGPVHVQVNEKERVNIPVWAGVGAIAIGGLLLGFGRRA